MATTVALGLALTMSGRGACRAIGLINALLGRPGAGQFRISPRL
jgi:hypothetical protein